MKKSSEKEKQKKTLEIIIFRLKFLIKSKKNFYFERNFKILDNITNRILQFYKNYQIKFLFQKFEFKREFSTSLITSICFTG